MKTWLRATLLFVLAGAAGAQFAEAQQTPSESLTKESWDLGVFAGGGTGLGTDTNTQFVYVGGRVGRIVTKEHFSGWLRSDFEWAVEMMPMYSVLTPRRAVYAGSFKPLIWQWNFTSGKRIAPYAAVGGGIVFSSANLPPGNTSAVNFTPQGAFGANFFIRRGQALRVEGAFVHFSNADLGPQNPSYNASLMFIVGYSWFRAAQ